jgi:putative peptidoglycan lipid II flippase
MQGAGIALALSLAGIINTALLLAFLRKNPNIAVSRALASALFYTLKLTVLSAVAVVPVIFLSPVLLQAFSGSNRIIAFGLPLAVNGTVFAFVGIALLLATKDRQFANLVNAVKRRRGGK